MCGSFLFAGDLNGHHLEWLGSTTNNRHGIAAFDFATIFGCDQLVVSPTHACDGTLDLLLADVPDLIPAAVVEPIGDSDYSSLLAVVSMAQVVPNLCVSRKIFLRQQVHWNAVCCAIQDMPFRNIWSGDNPVEVLSISRCWLEVMYLPRSPVCTTWISLGLMINAGMLLASSRRLTFGRSSIALGITGKSLSTAK